MNIKEGFSMKVAIVSSSIDSVGGVQVFTRDLSNLLADKGHGVSVFGVESLPIVPEKEDFEKEVGRYFNSVNEKEKYDVAICNGEFGCFVKHPKAINVFHGNYYGYAKFLENLVEKDLTLSRLRRAEMQRKSAEGKYVVTVSDFSRDLLEEFGIAVDRVIRNSVDDSIFHFKDREISDQAIASSRGRYYEKGFDILEDLVDRGISLKLFSDREIESALVANRGLVDNRDLAEEYRSAKALVFPSRFEGGSLVTLEAMACGCPIVTSPVGYAPEIEKKIPEFVVSDMNSAEEYKEKYGIVSGNRKDFSVKALNYVRENHSFARFKSEWISAVENLY
jgi:glycosyltransferase involved in cell wall biosynthesis